MQEANTKAMAAAAAGYAAGQCQSNGSSCSWLCNRATRKHRQQLATAYLEGQLGSIGSSFHRLCNGPTQKHRQQQQLPVQRANAKPSAATAIAYAAGQRDTIGSNCS